MIRHLKGSDSTSDKATTATFSISSITKELNEIKDVIDKRQGIFDKRIDYITTSIEKRDERLKSDLTKILDKIDVLGTDVRLHEYRLNKIDQDEEKRQ